MRADEKALAEYVLRQIANDYENASAEDSLEPLGFDLMYRAQLVGACRVLGALTGQDPNDLLQQALDDVERVKLIRQAVERDAISQEDLERNIREAYDG